MDILGYEQPIFQIGDLVVFTGHLYTPDYVYVEQYDQSRCTMGIIIDNKSGWYRDVLYRVYWFRDARVTEVVGGHLRSPYYQNKQP
tara:strand:+ start:688 stop:945 length:258 start_codon:yes stop_codon:yes gene_type:complete